MAHLAIRAFRVPTLRHFFRITNLPRATLVTDKSYINNDLFTEVPRENLQLKHKARLAGRKFLPGSNNNGIPEFLAGPTESFPFAVSATKPSLLTLKDWARECRTLIEENLFSKEAIILRDLPFKSAEDFFTFNEELGYKGMDYVGGGGNRTKVSSKSSVYTASDDPPEFSIEPHNELSYSAVYPCKIFLFCLTPAKDGCGGETPILQNRQLMARLDKELLTKIGKKNVMYTRYCPDREVESKGYMTWQQIFETDDRKEVEACLQKLGHDYRWDNNGGLCSSYTLPTFRNHPISGEKLIFNQLTSLHSSYLKASPVFSEQQDLPNEMYPTHAKYGDGSEIESAVLEQLRAVSWSLAVGFQWQQGDLLIMDNMLIQHARLGFTGNRKILVSMTED